MPEPKRYGPSPVDAVRQAAQRGEKLAKGIVMPEPLTEKELRQAERIHDAAPTGPWFVDGESITKEEYLEHHFRSGLWQVDNGADMFPLFGEGPAAKFAAHAYNTYPRLIAEIRRLREDGETKVAPEDTPPGVMDPIVGERA